MRELGTRPVHFRNLCSLLFVESTPAHGGERENSGMGTLPWGPGLETPREHEAAQARWGQHMPSHKGMGGQGVCYVIPTCLSAEPGIVLLRRDFPPGNLQSPRQRPQSSQAYVCVWLQTAHPSSGSGAPERTVVGLACECQAGPSLSSLQRPALPSHCAFRAF